MSKRVAFIFLSAVLIALSAVAELGATKSYWHAVGEFCLSYALWWLGHETCKNTKGTSLVPDTNPSNQETKS